MMSMSGKVLAEKVDVLQLTFYTAPVSCISILPALFVREVSLAIALSDNGDM